MNTHTTAAPIADALPDLQTAHRHVDRLQRELDAAKADFAASEARLGDDYMRTAEGLAVDPAATAEIESLIARERVLRAQLKRAGEVLAQVEQRTGIRKIREAEQGHRADAGALYTEHAKEVAGACAVIAKHLFAMRDISGRIWQRHMEVRGRSTLTESGAVPITAIRDICNPEGLRKLIEFDLRTRVDWYPCENQPPFGTFTFDQSVLSACTEFLQNVEILYAPSHASPSEIAAVDAEMQRERTGRTDVVVTELMRPEEDLDLSQFADLEEN